MVEPRKICRQFELRVERSIEIEIEIKIGVGPIIGSNRIRSVNLLYPYDTHIFCSFAYDRSVRDCMLLLLLLVVGWLVGIESVWLH